MRAKRKNEVVQCESLKRSRAFQAPLLTVTATDLYLIQGEVIFNANDLSVPVLKYPTPLASFRCLDGELYALDVCGNLWRNYEQVAMNVTAFNHHHVLLRSGQVAIWQQGRLLPLKLSVAIKSLANGLLLGVDHRLYDRCGAFIQEQVHACYVDEHRNIVLIDHSGRVTLVTDDEEFNRRTHQLLATVKAKKAVVHLTTLLLLDEQGVIHVSGSNCCFESGDTLDGVDDFRLQLPLPAVDFDFTDGVGWALLQDGSVWVWGDNQHTTRFEQWSDEFIITPRALVNN